MQLDTLALWIGPALFLLIAALGFARYLRKRSVGQAAEVPAALTTIEQDRVSELFSRRN